MVQSHSAPSRAATLLAGLWVVLLTLLVLISSGCTAAQQARAQCALDAVKVLPDDPEQATVADARDVIQRLKVCRDGSPDGGGL